MLARRLIPIVVVLTILTTFAFLLRYGNPHLFQQVADESWDRIYGKVDANKGKGLQPEDLLLSVCQEDLEWLKPYNFTLPLNYVSRDITTKPGAKDRPLVTKLDVPLFGDFQVVDVTESGTTTINACLPPLILEISSGVLGAPDASNMIFGLQTTISSLRKTVMHLNRWLPHTGARLYCIVKEDEKTLANEEEMTALEKEFHEKGMNVRIIHPVRKKDRFEQRYFSLVSIMYAARDEKTEWMVTIDDDTFFPSMHQLQKELALHDPSKLQYISALSEDWWAVDHYGLMGFGGASIILSVPLAKILDEHKHECGDVTRSTAGDITIMDCIYRFSTTKLTNIQELYQLDIHNDLSGFFESGRPVLSIHHWKVGSRKIELEKTHLVADVCDDCFLQRWQFQDYLILSNAYTIHTYPEGHLAGKKNTALGTGAGIKKPLLATQVAASLPDTGSRSIPGSWAEAVAAKFQEIKKIDLLEMEETWDGNPNVKHSLGPLRPKLPTGAKVQYKILDSMFVEKDGKKAVRQLYFREGVEGESDNVMALTWIPGDEK